MGDSRLAALAAQVEPPRAGQVAVVASGTDTAWFDLQAEVSGERVWCGRYVDLQAEGADLYVALTKTAALELDPTATGTATAPPADGCMMIAAGGSVTWFLPSETSDWRYLAFCTASGTGKLRLHPSSRRELQR